MRPLKSSRMYSKQLNDTHQISTRASKRKSMVMKFNSGTSNKSSEDISRFKADCRLLKENKSEIATPSAHASRMKLHSLKSGESKRKKMHSKIFQVVSKAKEIMARDPTFKERNLTKKEKSATQRNSHTSAKSMNMNSSLSSFVKHDYAPSKKQLKVVIK